MKLKEVVLMIEPIVKTLTLNVSAGTAFDVFTRDIGRWWPGESHSVSARSGNRPKSIAVEPKEGGAIYEITPEGVRHDWGHFKSWVPGKNVRFSWHPGSDPVEATEVEVTFEPLEDRKCRVTLTHSGWEVLGKQGQPVYQQYDSGWDHVFGECFGGLAVS